MAKSYLEYMTNLVPGLDLNEPSTMGNVSAMWKGTDGKYVRTPLAEIKAQTGRKFSETLNQLLGDGNVQLQREEGPGVLHPNGAGELQLSSETQYKKEYCADLAQPPKQPNGFKRFFRIFFKKENEAYERHQRRIEALKPVYAPEAKAPEGKARAQENAPEGKGLMAIADKEARFQAYQEKETEAAQKLWYKFEYFRSQVNKFTADMDYVNEDVASVWQDPGRAWERIATWQTAANKGTGDSKEVGKANLKYAHDGLKSVLESLEHAYGGNLLGEVHSLVDKNKMHSFIRLTNPKVLAKVGMLEERAEKANLFDTFHHVSALEYLELVGLDVPTDKLCDNYERFCQAQENIHTGNYSERYQEDVQLIRSVCQNAVEQVSQMVEETGRETNSCHLGLERPFVESHKGRTLSDSDMVAARTGDAAKIFGQARLAARLMNGLVADAGQLDEKTTALCERAVTLGLYATNDYHSNSAYGIVGDSTKTNDEKGSVQGFSADAKKELSALRQSAMDPDSIKRNLENIPGAQARLAHASVTAKKTKLSQKEHDKMAGDLLKDKKFLAASNTEEKIGKMLEDKLFKNTNAKAEVKTEVQKTVSKSAGKGGR